MSDRCEFGSILSSTWYFAINRILVVWCGNLHLVENLTLNNINIWISFQIAFFLQIFYILSLYDVEEGFPQNIFCFLLHHEEYVYFFISIFLMFHKMNDKMTKLIEESKHKTKTGPLVLIFSRQIYFWSFDTLFS